MGVSKNYKVKFLDSEPNWDEIPKALINEQDWTEGYYPNSFGQAAFVDGKGLMVRLTTNQSDPIIVAKNDGDPVHEDSALEFFCSFDDCKSYMNLEANAAGIRNCSWRHTAGGDSVRLYQTHADDLTATPQMFSDSWSITYMLPTDVICQYFKVDADDIKPGYKFKANFYHMGTIPSNDLLLIQQRIKEEGDLASDNLLATKEDPHYYLMWNRVHSPIAAFHRPDYFGNLEISHL